MYLLFLLIQPEELVNATEMHLKVLMELDVGLYYTLISLMLWEIVSYQIQTLFLTVSNNAYAKAVLDQQIHRKKIANVLKLNSTLLSRCLQLILAQ
jgi:hypothetical protein